MTTSVPKLSRFLSFAPAVSLIALSALTACGGGRPTATFPDTAAPGSPAQFEGPIGDAGLRGHAMWDSWYDIGELGYVEEEYFVSGTASPFPEGEPAEYTTRVIVRRPAEAANFNGTVLLDWVNVSAQFENAVDTLQAHRFFLREGYAYVHVSVQAAGLCCTPLTPQVWDPVRYMAINHPGDDYAFDIFTQIARGFKAPTGIDPMDGLPVEALIAMGQSQSAIRLHDYVNQMQPATGVIDGFLIHSDIGAGKDFGTRPAAPVLHLLSDAEAVPEAPSATDNYVLWEVAGAAHQDLWVGYHQELGQSRRVVLGLPPQPMSADDALHQLAGNYGEQIDPGVVACVAAGTTFPMRYAVAAAIHHLHRWVRGGAPPPQPPRYTFTTAGTLATDELNNALGGLRYPPIEVPVARYLSDLCRLGGLTIPLTEPELLQRYGSHAAYVELMQAATERSVADGFLLPADAAELMARAQAASNRWPLDPPGTAAPRRAPH